MPEGKHSQEFECDTEFFKNMENTEVSHANVHVHLDIEKKHDAYDMSFHCKGSIDIPCDRCLDPMTLPVDTLYHIKVKYGDEYNDESDDILVIPWNDTYLNVAYLLYDTIMLTIPLRHVHAAGECNKAMANVLSKHNATIDMEADSESEEDTDLPDYED